jgi:hypothetical protein
MLVKSVGSAAEMVSSIAGMQWVKCITLTEADIGAAVDPGNIRDQLRAECWDD